MFLPNLQCLGDVLTVSIQAENDATRPQHWRSKATARGTQRPQ